MPEVIRRTRDWLRTVVVGLDLCPFARGPLQAGRVRIAASGAGTVQDALEDLGLELDRLLATAPDVLETTLVVYPQVFEGFPDFVDATAIARELVASLAEGVVQLADFHPDYVFAGSPASDPAHRTNRSPYPMWHLLRESSVGRAVDGYPDIAEIPVRNARRLREMDPGRFAEIFEDEAGE